MLINWFISVFLKQLVYLMYHFKTFWCFFKEVLFLSFSLCQSYSFLAFFPQFPSVLLFCKQRYLFILSQQRKPKQIRGILEITFTFQLKVIPGVNLCWAVYSLLIYLFFRQTGKLNAFYNKLWSFICLDSLRTLSVSNVFVDFLTVLLPLLCFDFWEFFIKPLDPGATGAFAVD